jgi:hypothetical protein
MYRPRHSGWLLLIPVLVALALTSAGCGGSGHDLMVRKFFTSAATGDVATLGNIATVSFDPTRPAARRTSSSSARRRTDAGRS